MTYTSRVISLLLLIIFLVATASAGTLTWIVKGTQNPPNAQFPGTAIGTVNGTVTTSNECGTTLFNCPLLTLDITDNAFGVTMTLADVGNVEIHFFQGRAFFVNFTKQYIIPPPSNFPGDLFIEDLRVGNNMYISEDISIGPTTAVWGTFTLTSQPEMVPVIEGLSVIPGNDDEFISVNDSNAQEAHFPLGSTFQINLWTPQPDGSRMAAPASFNLNKNPSFAHILTDTPIFPHNVVFPYLPQQSNSGMVFQAVHEGTQKLTIIPMDSSVSTVTITLAVDPPQSLGSTHNDLDVGLIALGDFTGIPPQMIKGQIEVEGRQFLPLNFRYEPLNKETGDLNISRRANLRTKMPFANFRLPTIGDSLDPGDCIRLPDVNLGIPDPNCLGLGIGTAFSQHEMEVITGPDQQFHLRTWQRDQKTGQLILVNNKRISRRLMASDRYISALDIEEASENIFHFKENASDDVNEVKQRIGELTFTGEFPLAGSYGLLQMTYATAITELHWLGSNPPCDGASDPLDPSGLYDTPCNLQHGGGSLGIGTTKVSGDFVAHFGVTPTATNVTEMYDNFKHAYQLYNRKRLGYGASVIGDSQNFPTNSSRAIFNTRGQQ